MKGWQGGESLGIVHTFVLWFLGARCDYLLEERFNLWAFFAYPVQHGPTLAQQAHLKLYAGVYTGSLLRSA
jgi:hypothetical protein